MAKSMGPTWGPPGSCRPQMSSLMAPWTLLSGYRFTTLIKHTILWEPGWLSTRHFPRCWQVQLFIAITPYPLQSRHMTIMTSQITGNATICSAACSGKITKKTTKLRITGPFIRGIYRATDGFSLQGTGNTENVPMPWRHHGLEGFQHPDLYRRGFSAPSGHV